MSRAPLLVLALLAGCTCSSDDTAAPAPETPADDDAQRGVLVWATNLDLRSPMPVVAESIVDQYVMANVYLETTRGTMDCAIQYEPGLAASWSWDESGKVLTMTLRDDVTWADGEPVTAEDVAFTYELARDPEVASPRLSYVERMTPDSPRVLGPHEVQFEYTEAYDRSTMMSHASLQAVPKHVFEKADRATIRGFEATKDPVGNGPWRLAAHEPDSRFVLEPNPAYTGDPELVPKLSRVVAQVVPEHTTRITKLGQGSADLVESLEIADVDRLQEEHPEIRVVSRGLRFNDYIGWNSASPLFSDPEVRRALTMALDIDSMMSRFLEDGKGVVHGQRMTSTFTPALCDAAADDIPLVPFDAEGAKALLADKGWTDSDGDGVLDRDGVPFRFTLATNTGNPRRARASVLIQDALKAIGVQADLQQYETSTFYQKLRARDYDAAMAGWSAPLFLDPTNVWHCDTEDKRYEFNFTGYCNPEVDALMEQALATPDPEEAAPLWREMQAKIYADQPYTFLWWREELVGIHERFEDVQIDILSLLNHLEDWRVPADRVKYGN